MRTLYLLHVTNENQWEGRKQHELLVNSTVLCLTTAGLTGLGADSRAILSCNHMNPRYHRILDILESRCHICTLGSKHSIYSLAKI